LEEDGDERELDRRPDGIAEDGVVDQAPVVLQADPLRRLERQELLVREALVDRLPERIQGDEPDDGQRRKQHHPGEPPLPSLQARPPAASAPEERRAYGRGRVHRSKRVEDGAYAPSSPLSGLATCRSAG